MLAGFEIQQLLLLAIITGALILLLIERIRMDLTAVLIIIALAASGILSPEQALAGFSSEPAIVVASVFVLSGALYYTGLSDRLGRWITRIAGQGYKRNLVVMMLSVAGLSAFTHHLTITAIMLPAILKLCRDQNLPPSRLLMPMSFAASLGTTITILGAPAFLIADRILEQAGRPGLGVFSVAPIGLALTFGGTGLMLAVGKILLPERAGSGDSSEQFRLDGYYVELIVLEGSSLVDKTIGEVEAKYDREVRVVNWYRDGRAREKPFYTKRIKGGDVLLARTTSNELSAILEEPGISLNPVVKYGNGKNGLNHKNGEAEDEPVEPKRLVQAVIAQGSDLEGRSIGQIDFLASFGVLVLGIWRRRGWLRSKLARVKLRSGDVLVLQGSPATFTRLSGNHSFLMFVPFEGIPYRRHKARLAGLLMVITILAASMGLIRVDIALMAGALAVVLAGCLTLQQAYQSIDTRIFVFIAGVVPLGQAMVNTGLSDRIASWLQDVVGGWQQFPILLIFFAASALLTQLMSDAGTTAFLGPVAVAFAHAIHRSPEVYIVTIAMAAVASFLTPIGHHGNLLIYGPGNYHFRDFIRAGTPLTILVAALVILIGLLIWP